MPALSCLAGVCWNQGCRDLFGLAGHGKGGGCGGRTRGGLVGG